MYLDHDALTISRPTPRSKGVESYAHKAAKAVLVQWLRETAEAAGHDNYATFCEVEWRVNRHGPGWGIWEEYPLMSANGAGWGDDAVWDEIEPYTIPTYDDLIAGGRTPRAILNVAIQHKGNIKHGLEVVHRNGISDKKRAFLASTPMTVWVVEADWVLRQIKKPTKLSILEII